MRNRITNAFGLAVFLPVFSIFASVFCAGAAAAETGGNKDDINEALVEAEGKILEQDELIKRARGHLDVAETQKMQETVPPVPKDPKDAPAEARELADRASVIYGRDRRGYLAAYELADDALRIDPANRQARNLKRDINYDLRDRLVVNSPGAERLTPPEGMIAYKIAVSDDVITIEEAVDIAMKNNVQLKSMQQRIRGSEQKLLEAKRALFPTLGAEATANGGIAGGVAYQGETWKINFSHPIFDGGEIFFTLKQAMSNLESDKAKYAKERLEVMFRAGEAYRGLVNADYNLAYQNALFEEVHQIKERTDKEYELKLVAEVDYLDLLSNYNQLDFQRESSQNDHANARLIIAQELGVDPELPVPVDRSLHYEVIDVDLQTVRGLVQKYNWDIKAKESAAEGSYYALRVFDAKKLPKVEMRGSVGLMAEAPVGAGFHVDLENEHFIGFEGSMPLGGNGVEYGFQRRFFGPTTLALTGSEDYKHRVAFALLDRLADLTDGEIAKADYLQAKSDVDKERVSADVKAHEAYYNYRNALLQMNTSLSKIKFREKQVNILRVTTGMQDAQVTALINELSSLTEDRFAYVKSISDIHAAISNLNRLIGIEDYFKAGRGKTS